MTGWTPTNPAYRERLLAELQRGGFTHLLGTTIVSLEPGAAVLRIDRREALLQHHGYFHGAVTGAIGDNACGIAAGTLVAADRYPITSEYKINILRPASGDALIARSEVVKHGGSLIVCRADVMTISGDVERLCATMLATLVEVPAAAATAA